MEFRQAHQEAASAPTLAHTAAEEFDEIIYHITHDVRAALRALKSLPGWLREDLTAQGSTPSTSVLEILKMIETQAHRADTLLLDLRTYSRVGRLSEDVCQMPLQEVIDAACVRAGVPDDFTVETDMKIGPLNAPRNEFRELFTALLSNAVKHHHCSCGAIMVAAAREDDVIRISVEDDGPGIPQRFRERVFEMMATLRARDECPGSGLGLSIARKIVTRLGGTICAEEPVGGTGARIVIRLSATIAPPTAVT